MNFIKKMKNILGFTPKHKETTTAITAHREETINGEGNVIHIDKTIDYSVIIKGNNNSIEITPEENLRPRNISINITGNNNKIIIKKFRTTQLFIDIGNFTGVDNVEIEILENLTCVQTRILAYQSNTPIKIGANCLFSRDTCIRSGELPHAIYDKDTFENLDKSEGIFIGNHVWIGEHAFIMKKATIPDNCIVGAMSVVTKRFTEENAVIAGNPARVCKRNVMWEENVENLPQPKNK